MAAKTTPRERRLERHAVRRAAIERERLADGTEGIVHRKGTN